ncbi:MAG TPA: sugar ABC transporter substrate-binding protein [Catenuloplanes sp.]|jgi:ribose transport system substrate-binding protein
MLRRWVAALLVLGVVTIATGCAEPAKTAKALPKVGFVPQNTTFNYAVEMAEGFRSGVKQVGGVDAAVVGPAVVDGPAQLGMFQELTGGPIAGVAVHTAFGDLFAAPMAQAGTKGVAMMTLDSRPPPSSNVKLFVGNDNQQLGQLLADQVIEKIPADATGKIVIGSPTPGTHALDQRGVGMREQIRKRLPGVKVLGPFETKREAGLNLGTWTKLVKANPTALAFLGTGNADAISLAKLRASTGGTWQAGAFDLETDALNAVRAGQLVLVSPEHFLKGAIAGRLLATQAKDRKPLPQGWLYLPGLAVNPSNINAIIARQASIEAKEAYFNPLVDKIIEDPASLRPLDKVT